ncbi:hypothetical protein [Bacilliculturomica massiliensis]|uniref:hypothetical protein n=1 Tax=Bacilliculturomica massiliensis TaxID=1917867 RepID=UPI001032257F|nr:hypothetical protein [Bacilliculturomica massiliensis]
MFVQASRAEDGCEQKYVELEAVFRYTIIIGVCAALQVAIAATHSAGGEDGGKAGRRSIKQPAGQFVSQSAGGQAAAHKGRKKDGACRKYGEDSDYEVDGKTMGSDIPAG